MTGGSITDEERAAAMQVREAALELVNTPPRGVRVEDYLTTLAAATGEAALVDAGVLDIEQTDLGPGSAVFGDATNQVLSGDTANVADAPADTVIGVLIGELVPAAAPIDAFALEDLYRHVAASVGSSVWGSVAIRVPADNQPFVLPLRAAFELRPAVDAAMAHDGLAPRRRHVVCAVARADAIKQVRRAIDPGVALTIELDVSWGMAKMIPMSNRAMAEATKPG